MSIKRVSIKSDYLLEGILNEGDGKAGVVICHPHPLYGGNMFNKVVEAMEEGFLKKGFTTLRFNFRGVGNSGGYYDEGDGEMRDVCASFNFLEGIVREDAYLMLAGYSFGAWICGGASIQYAKVKGQFLVSYPFAFYAPDVLAEFKGSMYFVGGEHDDIAPVNKLLEVYKNLQIVNKNLKIIPTDHFYWGKEKEITDFIIEKVGLL